MFVITNHWSIFYNGSIPVIEYWRTNNISCSQHFD